MDTKKKNREQISAFADGALPKDDLELVALALGTDDGAAAWAVYHRIGDVLRAQASPELSPGFADRLAARLAAETTHARRTAAADIAAPAEASPAAPAALAATRSS